MSRTSWFMVAALAGLLIGSNANAETKKAPVKDESSFGALKSVSVEEARKQAETWLKETAKKSDAASLARFKTIWDNADRPLIDKVSETLALGNADAAKLLKEARDPDAAAPTDVPAVLKDTKVPAFMRANLTLAYAKALTTRKVYEEALDTFAQVKAEDVIDPASYLFHKAVCEHALMLKDRADASIDRLLVDAVDSPERYRMVAALMHFDMVTWQDKDLGWIARKMDNIQRRLDLKRGGKNTQTIQKEVLVRLDEMIKELENKKKCEGGQCQNGGNCPSGGQPGDGDGEGKERSNGPARDTIRSSANGSGAVDSQKVKEVAAVWGKLPEKERARALVELTRSMPAKDRAVIEGYFKELQKKSGK